MTYTVRVHVDGSRETELEQIIREEIVQCGPLSMARFMELALYHPGYGYYRRGVDPFGISGDFYTAEQLQPVFGELVATYVANASRLLDYPLFPVLELGSGRGELRHVLATWNYRGYDWCDDPLPEDISGLVIANEFFDALPIHLLRRSEERWQEVRVDWADHKFFQAASDVLSPELGNYAEEYGGSIPAGGLLETNLELRRWIERLGRLQSEGVLLVIDYGYSAAELARLPEGTLMSYRKHIANADILERPGTRDITAHVNFSDLRKAAIRNGYVVEADRSLSEWAMTLWDETELNTRWENADGRWKLQWKQLLFGMGPIFRVLELRKVHTNKMPPEKDPGAKVI